MKNKEPVQVARFASWSMLLLIGASGFALWAAQAQAALGEEAGQAWVLPCLKLHGLAAQLALIQVGWIAATHIKSAWASKEHQKSGLMTLFVLGGLALTGWGLYYTADETWRPRAILAHKSFGIGLVLAFFFHIVGRRLGKSSFKKPLIPMIFLATFSGLPSAALAKEQVFTHETTLMHTQWEFRLLGQSAKNARGAVQAIEDRVRTLDEKLAMWKATSELTRANNAAAEPQGVTLSVTLARVLGLSLKAARESAGAFDPSLGPLTQAWYDARQQGRSLSQEEIDALMPQVGWQKVQWDPRARQLRFSIKGMRLDLGGVAKGYALDEAAHLLKSRGFKNFYLNAGGQIYASGRPTEGRKWRVALAHPRTEGEVSAIIELEDQVMATSGDYEQYRMVGKRRIHHLLDPRTGSPTENDVVSATCILSTLGQAWAATWADIHGKPAMVLGSEAGLRYLMDQGAEGLVIAMHRGKLLALRSPGLRTFELFQEDSPYSP